MSVRNAKCKGEQSLIGTPLQVLRCRRPAQHGHDVDSSILCAAAMVGLMDWRDEVEER